MTPLLLLAWSLGCDDKAVPPRPRDSSSDTGDTSEPEPDTADTVETDEPPTDADKDGFSLPDDCDDADPAVYPGATEVCDGVDQDCDGYVDLGVMSTFYADSDGDGWGDEGSTAQACALPAGASSAAGDCDESDATVNPGASEVCDNRKDDDCDGTDNGCGIWGEVDVETEAAATLVGEYIGDMAGAAADMGDLAGDGHADVFVGAYSCGQSLGAVFTAHGPLSGIGMSLGDADSILVGEEATDESEGGARAGTDLKVVGDANGDGLLDLLVADDGYEHAGDDDGWPGRAYLFYGSASGLPPNGEVGQADVWINREEGRHFANTVAAAGDENGDGFADILVGSGHYQEDGACAYLFHGPISVGERGAADADTIFLDESAQDMCGWYPGSIAGIGDIDGDGIDDVALSSMWSETAGYGTGSVFLALGPAPSGSRSIADLDVRITGGLIDRSDPACCDWLASSVAGGQDLDGDGQADLALGAPYWSDDDELGRVGLFTGPLTAASYAMTGADAFIEGVGPDQGIGWKIGTVPDIGGDGSDDLLVSWDADGSAWWGQGKVALIHEPLAASPATVDLADARFTAECGYFGYSMGSGDNDGDGITDVLLGQPYWYDGCDPDYVWDEGNRGRVVIISGRGL